MDCMDAQKVTYATFMLKRSVSYWWDTGAGNIDTNPIIKDIFKGLCFDKYYP